MSGQDYGATALLAQTPPASSQAWPIKLFRFHKQISANLSSTLRSTKVGAPPMKPSHLSSLIPTPAVHPHPLPRPSDDLHTIAQMILLTCLLHRETPTFDYRKNKCLWCEHLLSGEGGASEDLKLHPFLTWEQNSYKEFQLSSEFLLVLIPDVSRTLKFET